MRNSGIDDCRNVEVESCFNRCSSEASVLLRVLYDFVVTSFRDDDTGSAKGHNAEMDPKS